jgi:hypothetical protein
MRFFLKRKEKKEQDEIKGKKIEKDETKEEYLPWHGRYSARLVGEQGPNNELQVGLILKFFN